MFWAKRLKTRSDDSSWAVPFGDLMSLLLAVFVMIAGMSELRPGRRFDNVGNSMKGAFGRQVAALAGRSIVPGRPLSLLERLELGLSQPAAVSLSDATEQRLPPCEVAADGDRIVIRVRGADSFLGPTGVLAPSTRKLVAVIADQLREGQARLEIRGYGPQSPVLPGMPYRDAMDVAADRARTVGSELLRAGIEEGRLALMACAGPAGGYGFEIVVLASPAPRAKATESGH